MGKRFSPKTVLNYTVFGVILILGYKYLFGGDRASSSDPFRELSAQHPKNVLHQQTAGDANEGEIIANDEDQREGGEDGHALKMDVGEMPKNLHPGDEDNDDLMHQQQRKALKEEFARRAGGDGVDGQEEQVKKKVEKVFHPDGVDWQLEEEMKKRRTAFYKSVKQKEEELKENEYKDMHERDDNFAFVTAGSHSTYPATLQFVYSVQYFYPLSSIAVYDIGLTKDEKDFINSLCKTEVLPMWLQLWPEELYNIRHRVWRPLVLQFSLARFGHFVYLEPGRFVYKQGIKDYISQSRLHGVTVGGRQQKYSSYVVTNPHMYSFLNVDERRLQKTPHFDFTMLVLHNTKRVRNYFMRYLTSCTVEPYCISPPGAKPNCDFNVNLVSNKRYAHCHRYDESAINLILNAWHDYTPRQYLMKDSITKYYDGKDVIKKVKVCNDKGNKKDEVY